VEPCQPGVIPASRRLRLSSIRGLEYRTASQRILKSPRVYSPRISRVNRQSGYSDVLIREEKIGANRKTGVHPPPACSTIRGLNYPIHISDVYYAGILWVNRQATCQIGKPIAPREPRVQLGPVYSSIRALEDAAAKST